MEASTLPWLLIQTMKFSKAILKPEKRSKMATTTEDPCLLGSIRVRLQRVRVQMPAPHGRLWMKKRQTQHFGFLITLWPHVWSKWKRKRFTFWSNISVFNAPMQRCKFLRSVLGELWECLGSVLRVPLVSRTSMASLKSGVSCELLSNAKEFKLQILGNAWALR